ncbi:MAG: hypothetical protein O7G87_06025 [bacterium]|nr:hypothetical protein [bacterium]
MKKPVWVLFLLCFLTGPAIASKRISVDVPQPDPVSEAWRWQFFTERDGLASVRVRDIAQSGTAVWLATDRGVSRYDGMVWQTFSEADGLASDDTWSVMAEPNGTVWVGTARGASRFDGQDWQSFTQIDGLPGDVVRDLLVTEDGQVWAATDGGAALLNGQGWKAFTEIDGLAEDWVNGLAAGPDGAVWFATERGASRFDGVSWQSFRRGEGLQGTSVTSVFADRDGALWFAQYGVGLSRYKGGTWVTFNESNGLPDRQVRRTFQTLDGVIWVICRSGLARLVSTSAAVEDRWVAYHRRMMPGLGEPYTAGVDAQGAIWIGGPGSRGVARFDYTGKRLTVFHLNQAGQIGSGNGIGQDRDGALWFGTEQGALRYDGVGWTQVRDLDGPVSGVLTDAKGTVYLMGRDSQGPAVLKVQGMTHQMVRKGLEGESVRTLAHNQRRGFVGRGAGRRAISMGAGRRVLGSAGPEKRNALQNPGDECFCRRQPLDVGARQRPEPTVAGRFFSGL